MKKGFRDHEQACNNLGEACRDMDQPVKVCRDIEEGVQRSGVCPQRPEAELQTWSSLPRYLKGLYDAWRDMQIAGEGLQKTWSRPHRDMESVSIWSRSSETYGKLRGIQRLGAGLPITGL